MSIIINQLVPELSVSDLATSLNFYVDTIGFSIGYQRKEAGFAFLALGEAQLMLDEIGIDRTWQTANFSYPLGRGINLQISVSNIAALIAKLKQVKVPLFMELEEKWYRSATNEIGHNQFLVMDPDGYLLRFVEVIGTRPLL